MDKQEIKSKKILVIEDDADMMVLLRKAVTDVLPEHEIFWAVSLDQAFTQLIQSSDLNNKKPYELIIADIFLEGNGTGLDFWRVLRGTYPQVPVLVVSSLSQDEVLQAVGEKEKINFLKKPFTQEQCKRKVMDVLLKEQAFLMNDQELIRMTDSSLLSPDEKLQQLANLIILKISADWLEKQQWMDEPYGGQNQAQDMLFHARVSTNRLWEAYFSQSKNHEGFDKEKIREHILQISELTPELKEFFSEHLTTMENVFHMQQH